MDYGKAALEMHETHQGKVETGVRIAVDSQEALAVAYTPGVAAPCRAIAEDVGMARRLTAAGRTVAVLTDGTAVLGLGAIGPEASLPVMEGKAVLFKSLANVDAVPLALATDDVDAFVETVERLAPNFAGINLEDIAAPACFEIERRLQASLSIPVMHDDQHGTAIVVLAGLINALKVSGREASTTRVVIVGAGAAGLAIAHLLHVHGMSDIAVIDSKGVVSASRTDMNTYKQEVVAYNVSKQEGDMASALQDADVLIGVSRGNIVTKEHIESMAERPIVFALSNPEPEVDPKIAAAAGAAIIATGRSDYPNQLNNVLVFPGVFRGAIDAGVNEITMEMKQRAAEALAHLVDEPSSDKIIPSVFDDGVVDAVSSAIH